MPDSYCHVLCHYAHGALCCSLSAAGITRRRLMCDVDRVQAPERWAAAAECAPGSVDFPRSDYRGIDQVSQTALSRPACLLQ